MQEMEIRNRSSMALLLNDFLIHCNCGFLFDSIW